MPSLLITTGLIHVSKLNFNSMKFTTDMSNISNEYFSLYFVVFFFTKHVVILSILSVNTKRKRDETFSHQNIFSTTFYFRIRSGFAIPNSNQLYVYLKKKK